MIGLGQQDNIIVTDKKKKKKISRLDSRRLDTDNLNVI